MQDHENPICGALGHYIGQVTVIYCPHHQGWTLIYSAGDEQNDMRQDHQRFDFGPFDTIDEVARHTASVATMLVRVTPRRWLSEQRLEAEHGEAPDHEGPTEF